MCRRLLLLLCCRLRRCCNRFLKCSLIILESSLKEIVGCELLILVTSEVSLGRLVLGETELCETIDSIHFLLGDSQHSWLMTTCCSSHSSGSCTCSAHRESRIGVSGEKQIHESCGILLNYCVNLGLSLLQLRDKLLIELRVLQDPLSNYVEVRVLSESCQWVSPHGHGIH